MDTTFLFYRITELDIAFQIRERRLKLKTGVADLYKIRQQIFIWGVFMCKNNWLPIFHRIQICFFMWRLT